MSEILAAACPKCSTEMIFVTSLPHPRAPATMRRTTFVCYGCNQTRGYSLSVEMAEAYAAACEAGGRTLAGDDPLDSLVAP
jgi:hypothetical protein